MPQALTPEDVTYIKSLVVHEDDHVLVFNKPSGLSVQSGRGQHKTLDDLLWAFAKSNGKRPRLVHRLDRGTSGVLVAAKTQPAAAHLGRSFMHRKARKTYLALTSPAPTPPSGTVKIALRRIVDGQQHIMVACADDAPDAEACSTTYRILNKNNEFGLVECRPHTGRMHQIRVHLQSLGAPIVGDPLYGGVMAMAGQPVHRLHLHARRLEIPHPGGGVLDIAAPVGDDLAAVWTELGIMHNGG